VCSSAAGRPVRRGEPKPSNAPQRYKHGAPQLDHADNAARPLPARQSGGTMRRKVGTRANDTRERIAKVRLPSSDNPWQNALFCQRFSFLSGSSWSSHTGLVKPLILLEGLALF
jgi:hypothetical protein